MQKKKLRPGVGKRYQQAAHDTDLETLATVYDTHVDENQDEPLEDRRSFVQWLLSKSRGES